MPNTINCFRDILRVDRNLIHSLQAGVGSTVTLAGKQVILAGLVPDFNYVIAADELTIAENAETYLTGTFGNPSPSVTVLARSVNGALALTCAGMEGGDGEDGADGESGIIDVDYRGRPIMGPGGAGEPGTDGGDGGNGGKIVIHYSSTAQTPTASAPPGRGGVGGRGGKGGPGKPPGRAGRNGSPGTDGVAGTIEIAQVDPLTLWGLLDPAAAQGWAAYRAEVAAYRFRKFDPGSQLAALNEVRAALLLNPDNADAAEIRTRIEQRQIPSGLSRDLDIAPDYPGLAADLAAEVSLVQQTFQAYLAVVTLDEIADGIREQLGAMAVQLANRRSEALAQVDLAMQDVHIAQQEKANMQAQIDIVQQQINAMSDRSFSIGGFLSTVGSLAGIVAGIASGPGAIISIPAGLAALQRVANGTDLVRLLEKLEAKAKDPAKPTQDERDVDSANDLSGDFKDLIQGTKSIISFPKVLGDLERAAGMAGQGDAGKLLKDKADLVRKKMISQLRERQAHSRVAAATQRVQNLAAEIADVQGRLDTWNDTAENLTAATHTLIRASRRILDMVMDDVFLAQRAREIYQFDPATDLRFDFGHLHPDVDYTLPTIERAIATLDSLSGFAVQVLSWNQIYKQLNTAQIGFDVIHPELSVSITNPAALQAFASGGALEFRIGLPDLPEGMFELKVGAMTMSMVDASTLHSANVWITHSGDWEMQRRIDGSPAGMHLLPRSEVFGFSPGSEVLTAAIPAIPQSPSEPGPPFSFWGRGVATSFRLRQAQPSPADYSNLSAIHLTIDCIGYARQGYGLRREIEPEVVVIPVAELSAAA